MNSKHLSWKTYCEAIKAARDEAIDCAKLEHSTIRSNGYWLNGSDAKGETLSENVDTGCRTLKRFLEDHAQLVKNGAVSITISGDLDGANSVYDLNNDNYMPQASEWSFEIWNGKDGWILELSLNEEEAEI